MPLYIAHSSTPAACASPPPSHGCGPTAPPLITADPFTRRLSARQVGYFMAAAAAVAMPAPES